MLDESDNDITRYELVKCDNGENLYCIDNPNKDLSIKGNCLNETLSRMFIKVEKC